jgi:hypothetical protein
MARDDGVTRGAASMVIGGRDRERIVRRLMASPPRSRAELAAWVRWVLGVDVPGRGLEEGSDSPLDYLCFAFFEGAGGSLAGASVSVETREKAGPLCLENSASPPPGAGEKAGADCVVWAARGAGKTFYAAVATALDLVFKPGIEVKILGGSREQSERMHAHLRKLFERPGLSRLVDGRIGERRGRLANGSSVEVLAQSQTSVRGTRPQKLRCDEVELFDEDVWEAAQLVTRSRVCGAVRVVGAVEALSTCHRAGGLMSRLIAERGGRRVFRWSAIDVLEECAAERSCAGCEIWEECGGRAKARGVRGHVAIDDAIRMKRRADRATWEAEMLCRRPRRRSAVFEEFDPAAHVIPDGAGAAGRWIAGMDFGFRSPTVVVWGRVDESGVVRVVEERVLSGVRLEAHTRALVDRPVDWVGVDPAGCQRSEQTGLSAVAVLRRAGVVVRYRRSGIDEGLRLIRERLMPAKGPPTLFVAARCERLIECLMNYRYPDDERAMTPMKDGHDHAVDALRYMLVNLEWGSAVGVMRL